MKKSTFFSILLLTLLTFTASNAQKVVIVGMNHISSGTPNDGFTFVATENIPAGEVIYFTSNEYVTGTNAFTFNGFATGEAVVRYVVGTGGLAKGVVVYMHENSPNVFTISCTSGNCGTSTTPITGFNLATNGDGLYAYSDNDADVINGITQIYSVMYTGSGEAPQQNGGNIPTSHNPTADFPNAIVVDGFNDDGDIFVGPDTVEYKFDPSSLRDGVSQTALENPANYLQYTHNANLSVVEFVNLSLAGANPVLTVTASPTSVIENTGTPMVYTFTLDSPAVGNLVANFSVGGSATFSTDYNAIGATTFTASSGTVTIASGETTKTITIYTSYDSNLEPDETVVLTITPGTGYDGGSPSSATVTIANDDTDATVPLVAVTGLNHNSTSPAVDGFSFVALDDIPGSTTIYFTENTFNKTTLAFSGAEGVISYTTPAAGLLRGDVVVATETGTTTNAFNITCNGTSGSACGTVTVVSGSFSVDTAGESFYAYSDTDTDPNNGVTAIYSLLYTGESGTPSGGNVPAIQNPLSVYTNAVVVDGFINSSPDRTEYKFAGGERAIDVDLADFQNPSNWLFAQANATLSAIPFNNIIISSGSANPIATVNLSPSSVAEDSETGMVYTFSLSAIAASDITINYTIAGTAGFSSDYSQTGATTFDGSNGSVTILNGSNSATVTITPIVDATVEPLETVIIALASGSGYNGGSPNDATGSITNDDTSSSDPLVAVTGMNHVTPDGFSFVAAKDIPANTLIYFTENKFDNTTLKFSTGEGVMLYTSPGTIIPAGDVIVVKETSPNVFSLTCNGTNGAACGSFVLISANLAHDSLGESLYAYQDSDNDPSNGVDDIYAVLFTGLSSSSGGSIPASEDPSGIYLSALVVDGFPASAPNRTEYKFASGERALAVTQVNFEDTNNWVHGQTNQDLSPIPFANLVIGNQPPTAICQNITLPLNANGQAVLTPAMVDNGSTDDSGTVFLNFETTSFNGETTLASPQDNYFGSNFYYQLTAFTVPVTGNYTFGMSGTSSNTGGLVLVFFNDTPMPNSGDLFARPEYLAFSAYNDGGLNNGGTQSVALDAGTTYYINASAATALETASFTITVDKTINPVPTFTCEDIGNVTQTLYVSDAEGNTSSCTSTITIVDTLKPIITCPLDQTQNGAPYTVPDYFATSEATATDNCTAPITITTQDPAVGSTLALGIHTITLTAEDENGNVNTCTFQLTIDEPLGTVDNQLKLNSITMYPNPTKNEFYLKNPQAIQLNQATLYDISGRIIKTYDLRDMGTKKAFNVSKLASATYLLIIKSEVGQVTKRLYKE